MRGLTVQQPWAQLIADGRKQFETRSWSTTHRGPLAIQASASLTTPRQQVAARRFGYEPSRLALGAIIAVVDVVDCLPAEQVEVEVRATLGESAAAELDAGVYGPGRYAWRLANVHRLAKPIPFKGKLNLWLVPAELQALVDPGTRP